MGQQTNEEENKLPPMIIGGKTEAVLMSEDKVILETRKISTAGQIERRVSIPKSQVQGNIKLQELDERVKSMMTKSLNFCSTISGSKADICKVCGKEGKGKDIRDHIEAKHLEGLSIPCNLCEKTFRSRQSLHKQTHS